MEHKKHSNYFLGSSLNTLAQNGTVNLPEKVVILSGKGSELNSGNTLKGRAKRKMITQKMSLSLIDACKNKDAIERSKPYWNTYYCQNKVYTHEGRLYGKYCKNRHCTLCSSIRKAEIINKYYPILKNWEKPYFVTLTIRSCKYQSLNKMFKGCNKAIRQIIEKYRKRHQRGQGNLLMGIKSMECNFNPQKQTYNPHLHIIVPNKETGDILMMEWLAKWTKKFTYTDAQFSEPVWDLKGGLIEIIKYGSKIFTEVDAKVDYYDRSVYAAALDNIFDAMKGVRIFDRFGFNLPKESRSESKSANVTTDFQEWIFVPKYFDWLNSENELQLTGYEPKEELKYLLEHKIDTKKE